MEDIIDSNNAYCTKFNIRYLKSLSSYLTNSQTNHCETVLPEYMSVNWTGVSNNDINHPLSCNLPNIMGLSTVHHPKLSLMLLFIKS